ncbi:T9SS type A sorting domain-containing protein [candidate division WOR-3 bacterium]|nr:T9SS type A sorting domain-containing protein [candidate division WOR-3 bacterium]
MKRFSIFSKIFLLFVCFSVVLSARWGGAGSMIDDVLNIPYVEYAPVIDGELDEDWVFGFPNVHMFAYIFEQPDSFHGYSDFSSFYKAAWNEDGFYFYGQVVDDSLTGTADAENPHNNDCWEIYFDGDNSKTAPYDENDVQWRWVYGKTEIQSGWADKGNWAWAPTANGYSFELEIPVEELVKNGGAGIPFFTKTREQLFPLEVGQVIGFETQVADNDGGVREAMTKWWSESNNSWQDPGLFGTATLADDDVMLEIKDLEFSPTIDGELGDEWVDVMDNEVPEVKMSAYINEAGTFSGDSDITSYYRVAWNVDGIYFFVRVIDDSVTGEADSKNPHNNDCFEIYFDGDNSKTSPYDSNDIQWRWVYGMPVDSVGKSGWADVGNWAWLKTENGYNFELEIPVAELLKGDPPAQLFPLEYGQVIGFEVQVADNDGGVRESMTKWWAADNNSWQDPGLFGTAVLYIALGISEPAAANVALSVPPVVTTDNVVVTLSVPAGIAAKVNLFNVAGRLVKSVDAIGSTVSLDLSGLANGIYLCRLEAGNSTKTKKITLIK